MEFEARLNRFREHVDRRPRTNPEALQAFLLQSQLFVLGVVDSPPSESTYRALSAAHAAQGNIAHYTTEQLGLLVESAWRVVQAKSGGVVEGTEEETAYLIGVLTPLPDDFPYGEMLANNGIFTVEALRGASRQQLIDIDGIGEARAEDIHMALNALVSAADQQLGADTPGGSGEAPQTGADEQPGASTDDPATGVGGDPEYLNPAEPYGGPHADDLARAGYTTNGEVYLAGDAELKAINGIGGGKLKQIRAHFERGS